MKYRLLVLLLLSLLFISSCNTKTTENTTNSTSNYGGNFENDMLNYYLFQYDGKYVQSQCLINKVDDIITISELSFPVYIDEYGYYFMAERTGSVYLMDNDTYTTWNDPLIVSYKGRYYSGLLLEDGVTRYFPVERIDDAYYNFDFQKDLRPGYEKIYFEGIITEEEIIDSVFSLYSRSIDGYERYKEWMIPASFCQNDTAFTNELQVLNYLSSNDRFNDYSLLLTEFGKNALINTATGECLFLLNFMDCKYNIKNYYNLDNCTFLMEAVSVNLKDAISDRKINITDIQSRCLVIIENNEIRTVEYHY